VRCAADYDAIFESLRQDQVRLVGPDLIYGTLFDRIGFNKIKTSNDALFKGLIVTRLYTPKSKLRTAEYMARFMHKYYSESRIYRFLDELCFRDDMETPADAVDVKTQVEEITFAKTKEVLGGNVAVVFYDTTSIYFESQEDEFRKPGWSKDGKNSNPQVVWGCWSGWEATPSGTSCTLVTPTRGTP